MAFLALVTKEDGTRRFENEKTGKIVKEWRVTGIKTNGQRFVLRYPGDTVSWWTMKQINLWSGTRWAVYEDGTKSIVERV